MSSIVSTVASTGLGAFAFLYIFIFLSGVWLNRSGQPYGVIVLTVHKLIAVAALALLGRSLYQANQLAGLSATELAAGVATGLLFVGTIAAGGLLATGKPMPTVVSTVHQVLPFLTVFATGVTLFLLSGRK